MEKNKFLSWNYTFIISGGKKVLLNAINLKPNKEFVPLSWCIYYSIIYMPAVAKRIRDFNKVFPEDKVRFKYKLMKQNAFRFFRGTCHLFYEDLSKAKTIPPSPLTWICGDLHIENFGSYKGDNRLVYFDLTDFDEAILAPASCELARMVTSILLAFDALRITETKALRMAELFLKIYGDTLSKGKARYIEPKIAKGIVCSFLETVAERSQKQMLKKRTVSYKNKLRLKIDKDKHLEIEQPLKEELCTHITKWIKYNNGSPYNFEVMDAVFRIAGTGSIGANRYAFLLKNTNGSKDYLLLDMKQSTASSLQPHIKIPQPDWTSEAQRITTIQNRMQNISPALLSSTVFKNEIYKLQEMQPSEDKINFKLIKDRYRDIYQVINDMAMLTASAQLRSSGQQGSSIADELIAFGKDDHWQQQILKYAVRYALKVKADYTSFRKAYKNDYFKVRKN